MSVVKPKSIIAMANNNRHKQRNEPIKIQRNTRKRRKARENACEQITIGFGLASHWLTKWREFCQPISELGKAKPKQMRNFFRHSIENRSLFKQ